MIHWTSRIAATLSLALCLALDLVALAPPARAREPALRSDRLTASDAALRQLAAHVMARVHQDCDAVAGGRARPVAIRILAAPDTSPLVDVYVHPDASVALARCVTHGVAAVVAAEPPHVDELARVERELVVGVTAALPDARAVRAAWRTLIARGDGRALEALLPPDVQLADGALYRPAALENGPALAPWLTSGLSALVQSDYGAPVYLDGDLLLYRCTVGTTEPDETSATAEGVCAGVLPPMLLVLARHGLLPGLTRGAESVPVRSFVVRTDARGRIREALSCQATGTLWTLEEELVALTETMPRDRVLRVDELDAVPGDTLRWPLVSAPARTQPALRETCAALSEASEAHDDDSDDAEAPSRGPAGRARAGLRVVAVERARPDEQLVALRVTVENPGPLRARLVDVGCEADHLSTRIALAPRSRRTLVLTRPLVSDVEGTGALRCWPGGRYFRATPPR